MLPFFIGENNLDGLKISNIEVGEFIRYSCRDKKGKYSHTGEVLSVSTEKKNAPHSFEMLTFDGIVGIIESNEEEYDLSKSTKPKGWAKFKKDPVGFRNQNKEPEPVIQPVKTKRQQIAELVTAHPRKKYPSLLKLAKKEIGGDEQQLSNYIKLALAKS